MSEPRKHGATGVWAVSILAGLILIPLAYLLILGPALLLLCSETISLDAWTIVAQPAIQCGELLGDEPKAFWQMYDRYLDLWVPDRAPGP
jgi:hypothetical protein